MFRYSAILFRLLFYPRIKEMQFIDVQKWRNAFGHQVAYSAPALEVLH